jgi:hypothetical protein
MAAAAAAAAASLSNLAPQGALQNLARTRELCCVRTLRVPSFGQSMRLCVRAAASDKWPVASWTVHPRCARLEDHTHD